MKAWQAVKQQLPNAITSCNLLCGCIGLKHCFEGDLKTAFYAMVVAAVFDFFDGFTARALGVKSDIGKQLDSLADVVTFGVLPGGVFYMMLWTAGAGDILSCAGFMVPVFSALRLAKFNIDSRQTHDFIGLNTPTNALVTGSLFFGFGILPVWVLLIVIPIQCFLLVSEIRMFSFKVESTRWHDVQWRVYFIALGAVAVILLKFKAAPLILALYIIFSLLHFRKRQ